MLGYYLQWDNGDPDAESLIQLAQLSDPAAVSFIVDDIIYTLTTGQIYRIKVLAYNSIGTGAPSTILEIMPASLPNAPDQPTVSLSSSSSISIAWT